MVATPYNVSQRSTPDLRFGDTTTESGTLVLDGSTCRQPSSNRNIHHMLTRIIMVGAMHASNKPRKNRRATSPLKFVQAVKRTILSDQRI